MMSVTSERSLHDLYVLERESIGLAEVDEKVYTQIRAVVGVLQDEAVRMESEDPDGIMTQGAVQRYRNAKGDARDLEHIRLKKIVEAAVEHAIQGRPVIDIDPIPLEDTRLYNGIRQTTERFLEGAETGIAWIDGRKVVLP